MPAIRFPPLPADTARATHSAFGKEHPYLRVEDHLRNVSFDWDMTSRASTDPELANSFLTYSLATVLQYWEDLTDLQMVNATRTRLDLKYVLHLALNFPGFDPSTLCRFRQLLLLDPASKDVFQTMFDQVAFFVSDPSKRLADADVILSTVCRFRQWEAAVEAMRNAIEALAASQPDWLRSITLPHWYKGYGQNIPAFYNQRTLININALLISVGKDGKYLLDAIENSDLPSLRRIPEIQILKRKWQYGFSKHGHHPRLCAMDCSLCVNLL